MVHEVIAYDTVVVEVEVMRFGNVIHTFHEEQMTEDETQLELGVDYCYQKKE